MSADRTQLAILRRLCIVVAMATSCAGLGVIVYFIFWTESAEMRTIGRRPAQFQGQLNTPTLDDYGLVFAVGHNAGTSIDATRRAIASGADVIEIDVVSMGTTLISAHEAPMAFVGRAVFRGPTLAEAWRAAADAQVIQLDLKESSPAYRARVISFLHNHPTEQAIVVATSDVEMLELLSIEAPDVFRFLSVPDPIRLETLLNSDELLTLIDGVTIRHRLVSAETVARLKQDGLIVLAWTVNDLPTVNKLVELGVDGVSTDNLAITALLGGQGRGEQRFAAYRVDAHPVDHHPSYQTGDAHSGEIDESD